LSGIEKYLESPTDEDDVLSSIVREIDQEAYTRGWSLVKDTWGVGNAKNEARTIPYNSEDIGQFSTASPLLLDVGAMPFDYYAGGEVVFWVVTAIAGGLWALVLIGQLCWTVVVTRKKFPL
jgi:hypothetical protein